MPSDNQSVHLLRQLLLTIENDILPLTRQGVANGNKVFGAALLHKSDHSLLLAETNNEIENPLWHGEMHLLKRFYELPTVDRPATRDLIFLSTHEPCSLCLSAITWGGFDNFYYLFDHQDSRDEFAIPHDLNILKEVFGLEPGKYNRKNAYWQCHAITEMVDTLEAPETSNFRKQLRSIKSAYQQLSEHYQAGKSANEIPLN